MTPACPPPPLTAAPPPLTVLTGASRGMGLAMAMQLLERGHDLLCLSRHASTPLAAHAAAHGRDCEQWTLDLAHAAEAAARLAAWLGARAARPPSAVTLINNAGMIPQIAPLAQMPAAGLMQALRVNLEAPMLLTAAFLRATADWPAPRRVLNISSGLARRAMASQAAYCAGKAGLDHYTRCVALEEAARPNGARVCSLAPGVIDTGMQAQLRTAGSLQFPDRAAFERLKTGGQLLSPEAAAARVLDFLERPDFGDPPVADVRD